MPSGILNLNKPRGLSSHAVVDRVRSLTGARRVGHAGTLDPLATGVLVVCVGRPATRVAQYLTDEKKVYRARVRLGVTTSTYDAEGEIVAQSPVDVDRVQVGEALDHFRGEITQLPPMYSAVKHHGEPLYRLARRGIEVDRDPRPVEIYRLEMTGWTPPMCTLEMTCSPGTYVRVLAHELGQSLGCGAHVITLTRLASGPFRLEDALTLAALAQAVEERRWPELLLAVDQALVDRFPALHVARNQAKRLCSGQMIPLEDVLGGPDPQAAELVRVYGPGETFLALAAYDPGADSWRPRKVLFPQRLDHLAQG